MLGERLPRGLEQENVLLVWPLVEVVVRTAVAKPDVAQELPASEPWGPFPGAAQRHGATAVVHQVINPRYPTIFGDKGVARRLGNDSSGERGTCFNQSLGELPICELTAT
jgi:hypothetical protein